MASRINVFFDKKPEGQPLSVTDYLSKILFNIPRPDFRRHRYFVMASDADARVGGRRTAMDKAYAVVERLKKDGYTVFIGARRLPMRGIFAHLETCVVARSYEDAIHVISKLGKPKAVYVEESQGNKTHHGFKDWLNEVAPETVYTVHREYKPASKSQTGITS